MAAIVAAESLESLLQAYYQGDDEALNEIVRRQQHRLTYVALGIIGNLTDAENAVQDTWINVMSHRPGERLEGVHVEGLLRKICMNRCLDLLRWRKIPANAAETLEGMVEKPCKWGQENGKDDEILLDQLIECSGLNDREHEVVALRRAGLGNGDISEAMELAASTVSNLFRSAKEKMLREYRQKAGEASASS